jgi:hypothetical protein
MVNYLDIIADHRNQSPTQAAGSGLKAPVFYEGLAHRRKVRSTKKAQTSGRPFEKKTHPKGSSSMAKHRRKQTPAQRAASLRNLKKARRARVKSPRRSSRTTTHERVSRRHRRYRPVQIRRRRRTTPAQRAAAIRNLRKARAAVTTAGRRRGQLHRRPHYVRAYHAKRRNSRRYYVPRHWSREEARRRRHGAMENPLGMGELVVGGLTGVIGFGLADVLDRFLASHALTDTGQKDANGFEVYNDTPPTSGNYQGLYNATAILAPMDAKRWAAGLGLAAIPLVGAHFVKSPVGRSALQFFGFGAGIRVVGKGLVDLTAYMTRKTSSGQRLYDAELRAMAAKAGSPGGGSTDYPTLPSSGVGAPLTPPRLGFGLTPRACYRCGGSASAPAAPTTAPASTPTAPPPQAMQAQPLTHSQQAQPQPPAATSSTPTAPATSTVAAAPRMPPVYSPSSNNRVRRIR